jgi:hypothetical protein
MSLYVSKKSKTMCPISLYVSPKKSSLFIHYFLYILFRELETTRFDFNVWCSFFKLLNARRCDLGLP